MWTVYSKLFIFCVIGAAVVIFFIYISLQDIKTSGGDKTSVSDQTSISDLTSHSDLTSYSDLTKVENPKKVNLPDYSNEFTVVIDDTPLKYILQWTKPNTQPFVFMGVGREGFIRRKCKFNNCVVTSDRSLLGDVAKFDVVLFHGPELVNVPIKKVTFPKRRSLRQKYVFASMESGHYYPICSEKLNGYFNWTWTFKLDSDARWGYLLVKDSNATVIGPNKIMHWMKLKDMDPVSEEFKKKLKSKSKAAAWFVSNCGSRSGRQEFAKKLEIELQKYGHTIDVFGQCGTKKCGRESNPDNPNCDKMVSDKYYFYLAFENSFSEDYVTEKLLRSLKNDAVPIVFGGANYTRFMPDGIYLNARALGPELLAKTMDELIKDPEKYANYFRWRNHYSYHSREETPEHNDYCNFCALLNDEGKMKEETVIQNLKDWWDYPQKC